MKVKKHFAVLLMCIIASLMLTTTVSAMEPDVIFLDENPVGYEEYYGIQYIYENGMIVGDRPNGRTIWEFTYELCSYADPNGVSFQYWVRIPTNLDTNSALLVYLHGAGECGDPSGVSQLPPVQYMMYCYDGPVSYIGIAPILPSSSCNWNNTAYSEALKNLIESFEESYNLDKRKVSIMGMSRGATGLWYMINRFPNMFASAVAISNYPQTEVNPLNFVNTKIWGIAGETETEAGWNVRDTMQYFVDLINEAGGTARMDIYSGATHDSIQSNIRIQDIIDWMLEQELEVPEEETTEYVFTYGA